MSGLRLTLKQKLRSRLDVSPLSPQTIAGQSIKQLAALKLHYGRGKIELGYLFELTASDDADLEIGRASPLMHGLGMNMGEGTILVRGSIGDQTGAKMTGGSIIVRGNTGLLCGAGMSGGHIEIRGDADDLLGGAIAGSASGMAGGMIHVRGNAGSRTGERMRRGIISIEGNAGELCGASMIAGTIIVLGEFGPGLAKRMRRGTILVNRKPASHSYIASNGMADLAILKLMLLKLPRLQPRLKALKSRSSTVEKFSADLAMGGRGEILVLGDEA